MKTIKEKAEEHGLLNPDIHYDNDGNSYDNHDKPAEDFIAGANYVLNHLSKTIAVSKDGYLYDNLKKMMEQLKSN